MAVGSAMPRPTPTAANQAETKPVPLPAWVPVPTASATPMIANPAPTSVLAPAAGPREGSPSGLLRGVWSRCPTPRPSASPPISGSIRTPLASESSPRTSRKNCGIANVIPNSANWTIVDRAVPQVNPAERNSERSTSGWPPGRRLTARSQATNAARATAPATMVAMAMVSDQPSCPARMTP